jgi:hypothetical protein
MNLQKINNYPLSSCNTGDCTNNNYFFPALTDTTAKTNMSVANCDFNPYFKCYNSVIFFIFSPRFLLPKLEF